MAGFIALAVALGLVVLGGALWPLWRSAPRTTLAIVAALGLAATGLYGILGTPAALSPQARTAAVDMPHNVDEAIDALRASLQHDPNQPEGWALLGRALASQGRKAEAGEAFGKALALMPDNPDLLVDAAQNRAEAGQDHLFDATAQGWLQHALQVQPGHQRALWFQGVVQRQNGHPAEAARTWQSLLPALDAGTAAALRKQIDTALADAGQPPLPAQPLDAAPGAAGAAPDTPPAGRHALRVHVSLAAGVAPPAGASVFVIARIPGGPPMPVAVQRHPADALPLDITLTDADSPMPTQTLSALGEVELIARLSTSGNAMRGDGDIESPPVRTALPAQGTVTLTIGAPSSR